MLQLITSHKKKILFLLGVSVFLAMVVICNILPTTPYDPDYEGDYKIEVNWGALPETLEVFGNYELEYAETGKDTVLKVWLESDLNIKEQSSDKPEKISLCPLSVGSSKLYVKGLRHNEKVVVCSSDVRYQVINPYYLEVDSGTLYGCKEGFDVKIKRKTKGNVESLVSKWFVGNTELRYGVDSVYRVKVERPDTCIVKGEIGDSIVRVLLDSLVVEAGEVKEPSVEVFEKTIEVTAGKEIKIVGTGEAESYRWRSKITGKDTVTIKCELSFSLEGGVKEDTIIVTPLGKYDYIGKSDTVYIQIVDKTIDIALVNFPVEILARRWVEYRVAGLDSKGDTLKEGVFSKITFSIKPDSEKVVGTNAVRVYYSKNPGNLKVSAYVYKGGDTSSIREIKVVVKEYRPTTIVKVVTGGDSIWLGETVRYYIECADSNSDGKIVARYYKIDDKLSELKNDTLTYTFAEPGIHSLEFWCVDNDGFESKVVKINVNVKSKKLYFERPVWDTTVYSGERVKILAAVKPGEAGVPVVKWKWDIGADGSWDRETNVNFIDTFFVGTDSVKIVVWCIDSGGDTAETLAIRTIRLLSTKPEIVSIKIDGSTEVWINDSVRYIIRVRDNGAIEKYYIEKEAGAGFNEYTDSIIVLTYGKAGEKNIQVFVVDNDGEVSDTAKFSGVKVKLGKPVVSGLVVTNKSSGDGDVYYINDTLEVEITAKDTNGNIKEYYLTKGDTFKIVRYGVGKVVFGDSGKKSIGVFVVDDDGVASDTVYSEIYVNAGKPIIESIKLSSNKIFVRDSFYVKVKGRDINGGYIKNGVIGGIEVNAVGDSLVGGLIFDVADSGEKRIEVTIFDDEGNRVDSSISVTVNSGIPYVESMELKLKDSVLWVRDSFYVEVVCKDLNGELKKIVVDFGVNGGRYEKNLNEWTFSVLDKFGFVYDTSYAGEREILVECEDADGFKGEKRLNVTVRKGLPVVKGDDGDTIWVKVTGGYGTYYYKPKYVDSNGVIDTFYFGFENDISKATPQYREDSAVIIVDEANKSVIRYIWVRDNDGYLSGGKFVVFADSAPPIPTLFNGMMPDTTNDSIVLKWERVMDWKDSVDTRVQIRYCYGTGYTHVENLFSEESLPTLRELEAKWGVDSIGNISTNIVKFRKPDNPSSSVGLWKVILIDRRGSESVAPVGTPATFVVP